MTLYIHKYKHKCHPVNSDFYYEGFVKKKVDACSIFFNAGLYHKTISNHF